jgi:hypothetical protein
MRRWPSWTKTIATITASAMKGIITTKTWSSSFHHEEIPPGSPATIEAMIMRLIPLPMPRCVISSPIHMSSVQPAVRLITISINFAKVSSPTGLGPVPTERKR